MMDRGPLRRGKVRIAGWGQVTQRKEQSSGLLDPIGLMAAASRRAAEVAGDGDLLRSVDGVLVVRVMSRHTPRAAERLAEALGASPRFATVSGIGGNSPQALINEAARRIARGEARRVLVAGGEAYCRRGDEGRRGDSPLFQGLAGAAARQDMVGTSEAERRHGVSLPIHGFPLFETALWAESGLELGPYLAEVAAWWSQFSRVAAAHPEGWTTTARSAEEIATRTEWNRPIALPYLKLMNPLVSVDLGAAVLVTGEEHAPGLSEAGRRPVYFLGGASAEDRQRFPIERSSFTASPPLRAAVDGALAMAGLHLDEVGCFDLYSCFPCAVAIARRMLCLGEDEPRPLTLTGGLGFFGGPGNNYSLHAVATLAREISEGRHDSGLVTGLGWFLQKHSAGVYGAHPGRGDHEVDGTDRASGPSGDAPLLAAETVSGRGALETYTVLYDRSGEPTRAVCYGRTAEGPRFVARTPTDKEHFAALEEHCCVGRRVALSTDPCSGLNVAELCE